MLDWETGLLYRTSMQLTQGKKKYTSPKLNKPPAEKTKALLLEREDQGDQDAKELLNLLTQTSV